MNRLDWRGFGVLALCIALSLRAAAPKSAAPSKSAAGPGIEDFVTPRLTAILDEAAASGDLNAAANKADLLVEQVICYAPLSQLELLRQASYGAWLTSQLNQAPNGKELLPFLRKNEALARCLIAMIWHGSDKPAEVYSLLGKLVAKYGDKLNKYPEFVAALCVVHDQPLVHQINENKTAAADPLEIFEYFLRNERAMHYGLTTLPAELMVYMVDSAVPIADMEWALKKFPKMGRVGSLYSTIVYDYNHLESGTVKKVTSAGFTLPNIQKFGGVCADQAYFCIAVGKAIGIPSAYTTGDSATSGHAWVGFLEAGNGKNPTRWNSLYGRYDEYKSVRGVIQNPQTNAFIPDSYLSLLPALIGSKPEERQTALAAVYALAVINEKLGDKPTIDTTAKSEVPAPIEGLQPLRQFNAAAAEQLIEAGLRQCPNFIDGWQAIGSMAEKNLLSTEQKNIWADRIHKLCGVKSPEFCITILDPMIRSIADIQAQNKLWITVGKMFTSRKDLSAEILMAQGDMWLEAKNTPKAIECYGQVVGRHINDGPFAVDSLRKITEITAKNGQEKATLKGIADAWARAQKPGRMAPEFFTQCNWYNVGLLYAQTLNKTGDSSKAQQVVRQLETASGLKVDIGG